MHYTHKFQRIIHVYVKAKTMKLLEENGKILVTVSLAYLLTKIQKAHYKRKSYLDIIFLKKVLQNSYI